MNFQTAAKNVESKVGSLSNDQKLTIYKYYKQATLGDVHGSRPSLFDLKGQAKWDSWASIKGMSKRDAEAKYISYIQNLP